MMDIRALFAPQNSTIHIDGVILRRVNDYDLPFIEELFDYDDVSHYYVLRDDHKSNLKAFLNYMENSGLNYIMESQAGDPMGLFSCEFRQGVTGIDGFVGYAMLPEYRRQGHTERALRLFCRICSDTQIKNLVLDISLDNEASQHLAEKCGFVVPDKRAAKIDIEHMELGPRYFWYFNLHQEKSNRENLCMEATQAYRRKDYNENIRLSLQALIEDCPASCPFSDGQIYANMAMSYSSLGQYKTAYDYLTRAYQLGIRNQSVIKELNWLRTNVPHLL